MKLLKLLDLSKSNNLFIFYLKIQNKHQHFDVSLQILNININIKFVNNKVRTILMLMNNFLVK
jgi:hypothetical protein